MTASALENAAHQPRWWPWVAAIGLAFGGLPLVLFGVLSSGYATLRPNQAKDWLRAADGNARLVDVRPAEAYAVGHVEVAVSWPREAIQCVHAASDVPEPLRGKRLLLLCDVGLASRLAAWHLTRAGVREVYNVRGGIQEWIREAASATPRRAPPDDGLSLAWLEDPTPPLAAAWDRWQAAGGVVGPLPFRSSPLYEQAAAVIAFFFFKPIYTLLSFGLIVVLWKSRAADLVALRWAMLSFFIGENACAVNYLVFAERSYAAEYLHMLGMAGCFAFAAYALLEGFDARVLRLSAPRKRCAALDLCRTCIKQAEVPCGLRTVFCWLIPAVALLALLLPTAGWQDESYNTWVFGTLYNYGHPRLYQMFENWYCPAAAMMLSAASLTILLARRQAGIPAAKVAFAAALGPLGFAMLRVWLAGAYHQDRVWYLWWEESTELMFIVTVAGILWTFRATLLPEFGGKAGIAENAEEPVAGS